MDRFINCIAHNSSEGNLLMGDEHTALFDCGMAFCAEDSINNVKTALQGRPLDYIIITHTHYDHIGALPFFREQWPGARLVTCQAGADVLVKATPRRVIRELSAVAAQDHGVAMEMDYDDDAFRADIIVKEGDTLPLGGLTVEVIETPGHTRDSLSFFIREAGLLIVSETTGVLLPGGEMYPCYLTGYGDALRSIEKCRRFQYAYLSLPHRGILSGAETQGYFDRGYAAIRECHDFIMGMQGQNLPEAEMLEAFRRRYATEALMAFQPMAAFQANARAIIACTLREQ